MREPYITEAEEDRIAAGILDGTIDLMDAVRQMMNHQPPDDGRAGNDDLSQPARPLVPPLRRPAGHE